LLSKRLSTLGLGDR
jgi:hypothetical protein